VLAPQLSLRKASGGGKRTVPSTHAINQMAAKNSLTTTKKYLGRKTQAAAPGQNAKGVSV